VRGPAEDRSRSTVSRIQVGSPHCPRRSTAPDAAGVDGAALETVLASMPLADRMTVQTTPLTSHPSD